MNVYAARNMRTEGVTAADSFGGHHSAAVVVLAGTIHEARVILRIRLREINVGWGRKYSTNEISEIVELLKEVPDESSVVVFADGEC